MRELYFAELFNKMYGSILIVALLLLCLTGIVSASQISVSGYVYGLWDVDTVLVTGDIRIPPDNDLTILPGVEVLFDGPWQMKVQQDAKIVAVGTPSQRIVFKPLHDGDTWRGIRMEMCCGLSVLDYCDFRNAAVAGSGDSASGGALYLNRSSLAVYHCTFDSCSAEDGGAISCADKSSPLITDCDFLHNSAMLGGAIYCSDTSRPLILSCNFIANRATLGGAAIQSDFSSPTISQNHFADNRGEDACITIIAPDTTMQVENNVLLSDSSDVVIHISDLGPWSAEIRNNQIDNNLGVAVFAEVASPVIEGNTITGNGAGLDLWYSASTVSCNLIRYNKGCGLHIFNDEYFNQEGLTILRNILDRNLGGGLIASTSKLVIEYNWITRNRSAWFGGISLDFCNSIFRHNTIAGNISDSSIGGVVNFNGSAILGHCIVYGNLPDSLQLLTEEFFFGVEADSCDIQGGWSYRTGNIDIDPQFRDTANGDFYATSDAIITNPLPSCGNEIPDSMEVWINPNATAVDNHQPLNLPTKFALAQNYPNPFNPATTITFSLPHRAHVRLEIFNALGQRIRSLCDSELPAGEKAVAWSGTDTQGQAVASGVYFYRLTADSFTSTRKMLLLK